VFSDLVKLNYDTRILVT